MIQTDKKFPEPSSQNINPTRKNRWAAFRFLLEPCLRFFEALRSRSHETFTKRVQEEKISLFESRSKSVIARRPGISESSLALARKKIESPPREKPILIVDDEKNIRLTLAQSLENFGMEIDSAEDGKEALAKLNEKEFALILLDIRMPGMDGMEVLRKVRETKPDIGIIILTAYGTVELAVEAMKLGAVDFVQKPFLPEQIRKKVALVISEGKTGQSKDGRPHLFN